MDETFASSYIFTIGVDFRVKNVHMDDKVVKLQVWDTAGQERFRTITASYYRGAQCIFLVYDVSDRETFENISTTWIEEVKKFGSEGASKVLLGSRADVDPSDRAVTYAEGEKLAAELGIDDFFETSAKMGVNINEAFESGARLVLGRVRNRTGKKNFDQSDLEKHFKNAIDDGDLQAWGRAKLMVIGEGAVGKTSTVRSLLGIPPVQEHISTIGVDLKVTRATDFQERPVDESDFDLLAAKAAAARVRNQGKVKPAPAPAPVAPSIVSRTKEKFRKSLNRLSLPKKPLKAAQRKPLVEDIAKRFNFDEVKRLAAKTDEGEDVSFSIWDYGGQEVFYALHHIFLSREGVYLLVFSMEKILHDPKSLEFVHFWLNSVKLHAPDAPIVLVGTRLDIVSSKSQHQDIDMLFHDKLNIVSYNVRLNKSGKLTFFPIDNSDSSVARASQLRKEVRDAAVGLKCVHRQIPLAWLKVLDDLNVSKTKYLGFEEVVSLAQTYGITRSETDKMLLTLHQLGVLVHQRATENLYSVVVVEPQWLLDKLSSVINDDIHVRDAYYNDGFENAGVLQDLADFRRSAIASLKLLTFLWSNENVDYLIDFMKETMLLCEHTTTSKQKYLVTSLLKQDRKDEPLDLTEFEKGLTCVLDFSEFFLPKGVFQRLVSTCASIGTDEPELSRDAAIVFLEEDSVAIIEERNMIRLRLIEDTDDGPATLKLLVSMFREQQELLFQELPWKLLLKDPHSDILVDYKLLLEKREKGNDVKVKPVNSKKKVPVSLFEPFFVDPAVGPIDSDREGSQVPKDRLKPLPSGCVNHVFISHKQSSAADMASVMNDRLTARGMTIWYDQNTDGNLAEAEMKQGIKQSKCYLLLLSKGVFSSGAVCMELKTAISLKKPIVLVHESQANLLGFTTFTEYIETVPDFAKDLFGSAESLPFQRRKYLADPFYNEIVRRINSV